MINLHTKSKGLYKLEVLDENGKVARGTDWFPNLVLDQGLVRMGTNSDYLNVCSVGSGTATPQPSNTSLQASIASTSNVSNIISGAHSKAPFYAYNRRTFTFMPGTVVGNISELGVGWSGGLFSRSLVRDSNGALHSLTVLEGETLRVIYEHRYYPLLTDAEGELEITGPIGGKYSYIIRPAMVRSNIQWVANVAQTNGGRIPITAYNGEIGSITGQPSGDSLTTIGANGTASGTTAIFKHDYNNAEMNLNGGIRSLMFAMGNGAWQVQFTPAIPKDSDNSLHLQFSHTWGRL